MWQTLKNHMKALEKGMDSLKDEAGYIQKEIWSVGDLMSSKVHDLQSIVIDIRSD